MCTSCSFDSSHCPDNLTPYRCANSSAKRPLPVFFTACTTVSQVRGRSPVPLLSWASQFSTRCNIHAPTCDLLSPSMLSMIAGSTCRYVPNSLHLASGSCFRAPITSECQVKNGEVSMMHSTQRVRPWLWHIYVSDNAPTPYSGRLNINCLQRTEGKRTYWVLQPGSGYCFTSVTDNIVGDMLSYKPTQIAYKHMYIHRFGDLDTWLMNVEAIHGWEVSIKITYWLICDDRICVVICDVPIGVGALYNLNYDTVRVYVQCTHLL